MLGVAVFQIVARNFFDAGFAAGDELVRMAVLWLTMVGSMAAAREKKHIRIDVLERFLPVMLQTVIDRLVCLATALVCAGIGYFSITFIQWEIMDGSVGVGAIPAWILELIIPISAFMMAMRYGLHSIFSQKRESS
ncbi:MAG: TRAP transporter small permease [Gammaproteobacteria bacterium]|nr:TRAP transporter small permease [Gammaproteobacteria bacterium]